MNPNLESLFVIGLCNLILFYLGMLIGASWKTKRFSKTARGRFWVIGREVEDD